MACSMLFLFFPILFASIFQGKCTSNFGDIRLDDDGLALLYLGPDGTDISLMWGTLSTEGEKSVYNTLCRQLGYIEGSPKSPAPEIVNSTVPVWLSNINCNGDDHQPNHILRCGYTKHEDKYLHDQDIYLTCNIPAGYREENGVNVYDGEVVLYPTFTKPYPKISVSFGMVAIKCGKGGDVWDYISVDDPKQLTRTLTDTLCREMGFTNAVPNSARTLANYTRMGYYFGQIDHVTSNIKVSKINCASSYRCIRCCLKEKDLNNCPSTTLKRSISAVDRDNALIIGCTFDNYSSTTIVSEGHKDLCKIKTGSQAYCPAGGEDYKVSFEVSVGLLFPLVLTSILITSLVTRYYTKRNYAGGEGTSLVSSANGGN